MSKSKWCIPALAMLVLIIATQGFSPVNAQSRILYGTVYSESTGRPIAAIVTVSSCGYTQSTSTASDGSWQTTFPYGTSGRITFSAVGYVDRTFQIGSNAQWYDAGGVVSLQPAA
jgi:hypothetical protein